MSFSAAPLVTTHCRLLPICLPPLVFHTQSASCDSSSSFGCLPLLLTNEVGNLH